MSTCDRFDNLMWVSYVKGRLDPTVTAEMDSHSAHCSQCQSQLNFVRKVAAIIQLNSAIPPESWAEEAAAKFEFGRTNQKPSDVFGEMVFDSYLHGKETVRSRAMETRHLIFDLPQFQVDVAMEYSGRQLNMLLGQLLPKEPDVIGSFEDSFLELHVAASKQTAKPNAFGEFFFKTDVELTGEPLELRYTFKEGSCVILIAC